MSDLPERIACAFAGELQAKPSVSLRGGNALDGYDLPEPFDPALDAPTDEYFERHWWGVAHLDAPSWRHYLPQLMRYALRRRDTYDMATEALLISLRPPDRTPPRLASLSAAQQAVVVEFLDTMAFDEASAHTELAQTALEEWWAPGALYRPSQGTQS